MLFETCEYGLKKSSKLPCLYNSHVCTLETFNTVNLPSLLVVQKRHHSFKHISHNLLEPNSIIAFSKPITMSAIDAIIEVKSGNHPQSEVLMEQFLKHPRGLLSYEEKYLVTQPF